MPLLFALLILAAANTGAEEIPSLKIQAGSELDLPPYSLVDEEGAPTGYAVDLLTAVARAENLELRFQAGPWYKVREKLESGQIDVLPLMAYTPDRAKKVDFSDPHISAYDAIFTRTGSPIREEADLRNKKVIVMKDDMAHDYFKDGHIPVNLITTSTLFEALKLLSTGHGDAVVTAQITALVGLQGFQIANVVQAGRIHAYRRTYAFAVAPGNRKLLDRLNHGLSVVRVNGQYKKIHEKWFARLDPEYERNRRIRVLLEFGIGISLALFLLTAAIAWLFRRQVTIKAQALLEKEQSYQQILDAISDLIAVKDPQSRLLWANKAMREYLGVEREGLVKIIGAPEYPGQPVQKIMQDDAHVFKTGRPLDVPEETLVSHDGTQKQFHSVKSPITDSSGKTTQLVAVLRDITERKEQERLISEQRAKVVASAKLSALGEMAGGIAHEINNPLGVIIGRAEQLQRQLDRGECTPESIRMNTDRIVCTSQRISKIVRSLKAFSRDSTAEGLQKVPLIQVIDETYDICRERFRQHGIDFSISEVPQDLLVECRPVALSQVLLNLLNNAYDAVEKQFDQRIHVSVQDEGENVRISVSDNGPGIPLEARDRIFAPFFTTKPIGKGTGIGLSISRGIMESHRGTLTLEPSEGGAVFSMRFPKQQPAQKGIFHGQVSTREPVQPIIG